MSADWGDEALSEGPASGLDDGGHVLQSCRCAAGLSAALSLEGRTSCSLLLEDQQPTLLCAAHARVCNSSFLSGISELYPPPPPPNKLEQHSCAALCRHEYGTAALTLELVDSMDEAISHIHENGSGHTEAIITGVGEGVCALTRPFRVCFTWT